VVIPGGGGFSFNQYLIVDADPLLFHTGPRKMFPLVREAVASVLPVERLRYIALSHVEADECGSLNEWLAVAPHSQPLCGTVAAMVSIEDLADRRPRALADGEALSLSTHHVRWFETPHCRTPGNAAFSPRNAPGHSSVAICSRRAAVTCRPSRTRTFWGPVRPSATGWITSPTRSTHGGCWSGSPRPIQPHLRACTAALGAAMGHLPEPWRCAFGNRALWRRDVAQQGRSVAGSASRARRRWVPFVSPALSRGGASER
jgi:hypothetical protein